MKTQEEILKRINASDSMFGFDKEVLVSALDFERAKPFLKEGTTAAEWPVNSEETIRKNAIDYLSFAFEKARDHRGLSAGRSVEKMAEYCWLLFDIDPDELASEDAYAPYGAPILAECARLLGVPLPTDDEELARMFRGERCSDDCDQCLG